ncbi:MAG TPA: ATP-dependent zinc metalloprotease FtsH [Gaiellaceae bacterium]|nr:ATP-dependent zinc metalloprotease FtsH [Gaiellaceae bacterium]
MPTRAPRSPTHPAPERRPGWRPLVWAALIAVTLVIVGRALVGTSAGQSIPYSRFLALVQANRVVKVEIGSQTLSGTYEQDGKRVRFTSTRPPDVNETTLLDELSAHDVEFSGSRPSGFTSFLLSLLAWLLPIALLIGFWMWFIRRAGAGGVGAGFALGRSQHKIFDRRDLRTSFKDVAGLEEAVEELREVVDFLKRPERYRRLGGRIPKGVLLVGPPGTGKTLLARAVAGEAEVPFFYLSGSNFVQMFVGLGAARVRDLFEQAKANAPCIVFIDELDTIGRSRAAGMAATGSHEEREQTLNQLLSEMDGFDPAADVIIMAATNRPEVLDQALLRPGRFDRQIVVDLPDRRGREAILRIHARGVALAADVDLDVLAGRTPGAAGAELANIVNEAALLAARRGKAEVGMDELEEAVDRVSMGLERRSRVLSPHERERVAYHELGHALVALSCPHADPVHRVSIVPRGVAAIGVTQQVPAEDRYVITQPELEARLTVLMGGRAAERMVYGELSTGAQNDLQQATALARRMVEEFGMSDAVGPVALRRPGLFLQLEGGRSDQVAERTVEDADADVRRLLEQAQERAEQILGERRADLDRVARVLLERETLEGDDLKAALQPPRRARGGQSRRRSAAPAR